MSSSNSEFCYNKFVQQQRKLQPYSNKINYPNPNVAVNWQGPPRDIPESELIPFGYQPKRHNPGGLKFSMYSYPYQTTGNVPLTHPGRGWRVYENTGQYSIWW